MAEGKIKVDIDLNIIDDNSQYAKTRRRFYNIYHRDMSDKEIIEELCNEIDYYRHEIDLLKKVHEENRDCINKQDELIKEYQEIIKETLDKRFEITIDSEKYIIIYNSHIEVNTIELNAYLTKLINEKDKIMICKDNQFKIINETRKRNREMYLENWN